MEIVFQQYLQILLDAFKYDIHVVTTPWVWHWVIPLLIYLWFFILKWVFLTIPICLPFYLFIVVYQDATETSYKKKMIYLEKLIAKKKL